MLGQLFRALDKHYDEMVEIRRHLHQYPELSFQEVKTAKFIAQYYERLGIPVQTNVGGNGVIATLEGKRPGKTVAFRADFDALPIQDEKDVPYKSKVPGVMHACGHDAHTATLLVFAKVLQQFQDELPGTVVFVHQHAEELTPGGAISIVQSGALDHIDVIFGNHLWSTLPLGTVSLRHDALMAGADRFQITIYGEGGHGAYPEDTKDALVIGAEIVAKLQTIVSRKISPVDTGVVTVGRFQAGTGFNIIANEAVLEGTIRYFKNAVKKKMKEELYRIVKGVCLANDATYKIDYTDGYPPVINHKDEAELIFEAAKIVPGVNSVLEAPLQMGAEDFSYYLHDKPGAFFFTGAGKEGENHPHHHPLFDIDERSILIAAKTFAAAFIKYQEKEKTSRT